MDTACKAGGDKNDTSGRALIIGPEKDFGQTTSVIERETGFQEDRLDLISDSSYQKKTEFDSEKMGAAVSIS